MVLIAMRFEILSKDNMSGGINRSRRHDCMEEYLTLNDVELGYVYVE